MELVAGDGVVGSDARADVRLLVAHRATGELAHDRFADLPGALRAGDVLVVNTSAVIPAAVEAMGPDGRRAAAAPLHRAAGRLLGGRAPAPGRRRHRPLRGRSAPLAGARRRRPGRPCSPDTPPVPPRGASGWPGSTCRPTPSATSTPTGSRSATPTSRVPGRSRRTSRCSPASPARPRCRARPGPFTDALVTDLVRRGRRGVAGDAAHRRVLAGGGRGPVRGALPGAARRRPRWSTRPGRTAVGWWRWARRSCGPWRRPPTSGPRSHPGEGWTETVITPERGVRVVDGLLTGWHEPESSHLAMLETIAGRPLLEASYEAAVDRALPLARVRRQPPDPPLTDGQGCPTARRAPSHVRATKRRLRAPPAS